MTRGRPDAAKGPAKAQGPLRNTMWQLAAQLTGAGFTAVLTLYLVRALGPKGFGVFALAVSISLLVLLPSDFGLSAAVARFLAERRDDPQAVSSVLARGLQLKLIAGTVTTIGLFAAAPLIADAYGDPGLTWPLRWISTALFGHGLIYLLNAGFAATRTVWRSLKLYICESAVETGVTIGLVVLGTGVTGASLGRAVGYTLGGAAGLILARPILGPVRQAWRRRRAVPVSLIARYASAMMIVDASHTAIAQVDVLIIGAVVSVGASGPFAAVVRLFTLLTYLGSSVAAGVAPRLARNGGGAVDTQTFGLGLKYVVVFEGLLLAPLVVWAKPIVALVLGSGYHESIGVMRALAPSAVLGGLAPVLALGVNYLGEARLRVPVMLSVLVFGLGATYVLVNTGSLVGAAIADDLVLLAHVVAHLWICRRLIEIELGGFLLTNLRTVAAAIVMGVTLALVGTSHLSPLEWIFGGIAGTTAFAVTLLLVGEVSKQEIAWLRDAALMVWRRVIPPTVGV